MCVSEDIGGWQICDDTLIFIEKYLCGSMKKCFVDMQNLQMRKVRFRTELLLQSKKKPMRGQKVVYLPVTRRRPRFKSLQESEPVLSAFR